MNRLKNILSDFEIDHKALFEAIKEALRLGMFAFVSTVVAFILKKLELMDQSEMVVMVGVMALRMFYRWLHVKAKLDKGYDGQSHCLLKF